MFEGIGHSLHLVAAVAWVGGLAALVLALGPAANRTLDSSKKDELHKTLYRLLNPIALASAAILLLTGLMITTSDSHFKGWGEIGGPWAKLMIAKHVLYLLMIIMAVIFWRTKKNALRKELVDMSFWMGLIVLGLTGFLTAME